MLTNHIPEGYYITSKVFKNYCTKRTNYFSLKERETRLTCHDRLHRPPQNTSLYLMSIGHQYVVLLEVRRFVIRKHVPTMSVIN